MKLIATAEQMRAVDSAAIHRYGISGIVLMENAGVSFVREMERLRTDWSGLRVAVLCGRGNNGGDGFVIARHLANRGAHLFVFLAGKKGRVKGDAKKNLSILLRMAKDPESRIRFTEVNSIRSLKNAGEIDVIVDALLGTGFSGAIKGIERGLVQWMNGADAPVYSVDIPSGVNATNGLVGGEAVNASVTITMGLTKVGLVMGEGRDRSGDVRVVDIGLPGGCIRPGRADLLSVERDDVRNAIPPRSSRAHKHSVGKIVVIAGSRNYTGAPFLCAQSALRAGAGSVILMTPASIHQLLARKLTEVMVQPVAETDAGTIAVGALEEVLERLKWADVVVVGPGLSRHPESMRFVSSLLLQVEHPLVLDADGLAPLREKPGLLRRREVPAVLTPHTGELAFISDQSAAEIETGRVDAARTASQQYRSTVVLKGSPTLTAVGKGAVVMNTTGNSGMATAGSGDVLAGIIAGLIGQGAPSDRAAWAGAYLHGLAGDIARKKFGDRGFMAHDISDQVPHALSQLDTADSKPL